jgi:hypothetical protein
MRDAQSSMVPGVTAVSPFSSGSASAVRAEAAGISRVLEGQRN